ncbi:MAG TPA: LysR family transcriptional regulator [Bryobacteraceae bacterium]|nr:LysR family transcriptional regulator [Bryobacteraceae bacterium]
MCRLREMEIFVRVVETGSFSAAARDFKIGQPAISKMVAGLEDRLSARLLVRSTRRLSPTEAGIAFYERALRTLTEADEAEAVVRGAGAGLEGRLRICAPVTFARMHLFPTLGAFLDTHPKLKLVMEDRTVNLVAENIDVALRWGASTDSALVARKLTQANRLVVAAPAYLARRGVPNTPADLVEHDAIVYDQSSGGEEWRFRRGTSETSVRIQRRLTVSAAEGVRAAVIAGQGFAISPRWMFAPELESGEVASVLDEWTLPPIDLWVIFPSGRLTSTKARTFVKWFENTMSVSPLIRQAAADSHPLRLERTITPLSTQPARLIA